MKYCLLTLILLNINKFILPKKFKIFIVSFLQAFRIWNPKFLFVFLSNFIWYPHINLILYKTTFVKGTRVLDSYLMQFSHTLMFTRQELLIKNYGRNFQQVTAVILDSDFYWFSDVFKRNKVQFYSRNENYSRSFCYGWNNAVLFKNFQP